MLNPSTADERILDPTVRRCTGYAMAWGFGSIEIVNLFALRSTDPAELYRADDPVGPDNDLSILWCASSCTIAVAAWGTHGQHLDRGREVVEMLRGKVALKYLRLTKSGEPNHPLYLPKDLKPRDY